jgi:predicted dehydrogenase
VLAGELGEFNAVRLFFVQGTLRKERTPEQQRRFAWKTDPARAGVSGCFGDIGIHAYNLLRFVTALVPTHLACHLHAFEPGGRLDDYGTALLRFTTGALGTLTASRISHGRENGLRFEIDGTNGSLAWQQEEPNRLLVRANGQPHRVYTRAGGPYLAALAARSTRLPAGNPEGFFEAFANVYTAVFDDILRRAAGERVDPFGDTLYPNVGAGMDGMRFVARCVASAAADGAWVALGGTGPEYDHG